MNATFPIEPSPQPIVLTELPADKQAEARETLERGEDYFFDGRLVETVDAPPPDAAAEWVSAISSAVLTPIEIGKLNLPKRQPILGTWFLEGDLGFIYGPRGLGKTWLAMLIASAISDGKSVGPWKANDPRKVLYVDGEMAIDASLERAEQMRQGDARDSGSDPDLDHGFQGDRRAAPEVPAGCRPRLCRVGGWSALSGQGIQEGQGHEQRGQSRRASRQHEPAHASTIDHTGHRLSCDL